jgi:hypothetical protein
MKSGPKKFKNKLPPNWRRNIEFEIDGDEFDDDGVVLIDKCRNVTVRLQFKKGKTPTGFKKTIGEIVVDRDENCFVESARIDQARMRRRGLGKMMYSKAIETLGMISTDYHNASTDAQRVWRSLIRDFVYEADYFNPHLTVYNVKKRKEKSSR